MAKFTIRQRKDYTIEANSIEDAFNLLIENMSEIDADNQSNIGDDIGPYDGAFCFVDQSNGKVIHYGISLISQTERS